MFLSRLRLCDGLCEPAREAANGASGDRYSEFGKVRSAALNTITTPVQTHYTICGVLGKGAFGLVKEGIHLRTGRKAALKLVERKALSTRDEQLLLGEAGILSGLAHGNIVSMLQFFRNDDLYCLALEHMSGGELFQDIVRRSFYSEGCARRIVLQVLDALAFLHRRGIVHRDVKPENLLLPRPGCQDVKLADFGFATVLAPPTYKAVEPVGTPGYAAPELLRLLPYDGKVDVFSTGVIAHILLAGYRPFEGNSVREAVAATIRGEIKFSDAEWSAASADAKHFVKMMLSSVPNARPTAEEALNHPWMKAPSRRLRSRPLSDRRSGGAKSLLEEYQKLHKNQEKKAAGEGPVIANHLSKLLETTEPEADQPLVSSQAEEAQTTDAADAAGGTNAPPGKVPDRAATSQKSVTPDPDHPEIIINGAVALPAMPAVIVGPSTADLRRRSL